MTLELKWSQNYAGVVHLYDKANEVPLPNRDRVVGYKALGYQSIVGKDSFHDGEPVIVFGAETQLSEDFVKHNGLYRHSEKNADPTKTGYLEDSRRIKAIKFAGHRSDALVMPVSSLDFARTGEPVSPLAEWEWELLAGVPFDHVNGVEISRKYVVRVKGDGRAMATRQGQKRTRVLTESFPEHFDTPNGFRNVDAIRDDEFVVVTQKLHGSSVRIGHVPVRRDLKWYERLAKRFGVKVQETEYGVVVGSRRVTKSVNGDSDDLWTKATEGMGQLIPHDFIVFAEVIGWTPDGAPIQPGYTYNVPQGHSEVYVYRVATINDQGDLVDLPWRGVERFAEARGWNVTPVLTQGFWLDVESDIEGFMDVRYADGAPYYEQAVPLSDPKTVDEGVVVRTDAGFTPTVLKFKSPAFLRHESVVLDKGEADVESLEGSVA